MRGSAFVKMGGRGGEEVMCWEDGRLEERWMLGATHWDRRDEVDEEMEVEIV